MDKNVLLNILPKIKFQNVHKYKQIKDSEVFDSSFINKTMANLIGLEDGRWFKIVNLGDGSVIEVENGNKLVSKPDDPTKEDCQRFRSILQPSGKYAIASKYQTHPDYIMVWDYLPHRRLLMQKKQTSSARSNQAWQSLHVPGMQSLYFLLSAPDCTKCLKNVGVGKQIQIVAKSDQVTGDRFAHWTLEQMGPVLTS